VRRRNRAIRSLCRSPLIRVRFTSHEIAPSGVATARRRHRCAQRTGDENARHDDFDGGQALAIAAGRAQRYLVAKRRADPCHQHGIRRDSVDRRSAALLASVGDGSMLRPRDRVRGQCCTPLEQAEAGVAAGRDGRSRHGVWLPGAAARQRRAPRRLYARRLAPGTCTFRVDGVQRIHQWGFREPVLSGQVPRNARASADSQGRRGTRSSFPSGDRGGAQDIGACRESRGLD